MFSKNLSLDISRPYIYRKFEILYVKGQGNLQTQQLILIYAKVNNYLNSWTKFPLLNRQKLSNLTVNCQSYQMHEEKKSTLFECQCIELESVN